MAGTPEEVARLFSSSSEDEPGQGNGSGRTHGEYITCRFMSHGGGDDDNNDHVDDVDNDYDDNDNDCDDVDNDCDDVDSVS